MERRTINFMALTETRLKIFFRSFLFPIVIGRRLKDAQPGTDTSMTNLHQSLASEQHQCLNPYKEFPSGLPFKYCPGPMLLICCVLKGTGLFNMALPATFCRQKSADCFFPLGLDLLSSRI